MPVTNQKFDLKGTIAYSPLDASDKPTKWFTPGCQEDLSLSVSTDVYEHENKCGAIAVTDYRKLKKMSLGIKWTQSDFSIASFAAAFAGKSIAAVASGTATNEVICADATQVFAVDDQLFLVHQGVTSLVLKDGSAATISAGNYTFDATTGIILFTGGSSTAPITASYSYVDPKGVALLTAGLKSYALSFRGTNIANGVAGTIYFPKVSVSLSGDFGLQTDEIAKASFEGSVLKDPNATSAGTYGDFGRVIGFGLQ